MMKPLLRAAAALLATVTFALPARATTYSTDFTDLWYNPNESGWGVNFIQQGNVLFATLFVYGVGNVPQWFTASDMEPSPAGSQTTFTGQLFQTSGPYFAAGSFDPNQVTRNTVGTMTVVFNSPSTATLQYTVNGATVTKSISRQTWRSDDLTGNYLGGLTAATTRNCPSVPNQAILIFQLLDVQHSSNQISMTVQFTPIDQNGNPHNGLCTFAGPYTQTGHLGAVSGNWNCSFDGQPNNTGTFTLSSILSSTTGFSGHFTGSDQYCSYDGQFGGIRDIPNPPQ